MKLTKVCKDCPDRHPACWGSCPKYLEAKAEHEAVKQAYAKDRAADSLISGVQYYGLRRWQKERNK